MKILVTGASGYLGSIFVDLLKTIRRFSDIDVFCAGHQYFDVCYPPQMEKVLDAKRPDVIFHFAASADTDQCERDFVEAMQVNAVGTYHLASLAMTKGIDLVYFSSACLYPNNNAWYTEKSPIEARCRYTKTKLAAEMLLEPWKDRMLIIRMRQPFSYHIHRRNLLDKIVQYEALIDEPNSLSCVEDCLPVVWNLYMKKMKGIYNVVNPGAMSPMSIVELIKKYPSRVDPIYSRPRYKRWISFKELLSMVSAERVNSLVSIEKLKAAKPGLTLPPVRSSILGALYQPCTIGTYNWYPHLHESQL